MICYSCASRGRGIRWKQRLEVNYTGFANSITSVNKDSYVLIYERKIF